MCCDRQQKGDVLFTGNFRCINPGIIDKVSRAGSCCVLKALFLAHPIRTSEILPWDRKSYLTHVILPRLPHE